MPDTATIEKIPEARILHEFSTYICEWHHRYGSGKFINRLDQTQQFAFLPNCFTRSITSGADICLTQDLSGQPIFARTSDGTMKLTSDDTGLLAHVKLVDNPQNRHFCFLMRTNQIRGWSHRAVPLLGGFRVRKEGDIHLHEHHQANLTEITAVVKKYPRAQTRKTPLFLFGGPQAKGIAHVL